MKELDIGIVVAFVIYLIIVLIIGVIYYTRTKTVNDFILGSRKLNKYVTSLSAEASDMSGWLFIGLPGFAYASGMEASWVALGLIIGTFLNWTIVAKRLWIYTQKANDSLTIPEFFRNRFDDRKDLIGSICAIFILIFFLLYTSAQFVFSGKLFNTVFGIDYTIALLIGSLVVVAYTLIGGFMAVCWTDFFQGILMFFAILAVPIAAMAMVGGPVATADTIQTINPNLLNPFTSADGSPLTYIAIISLLAWGLGYFGQPHILVRFMAIKKQEEIKDARLIAMIWVILSLTAAVGVGLIGHAFLTKPLAGPDSETVFTVMTNQIFFSFTAGIILCGILAAIMSTASSQLLVSASAISEDLYRGLLRPEATGKELNWVSRISVLVIAVIAIFLAFNPENFVYSIIAYAWAGFGAAFGPTILLALYWKRMTRAGALAGIISGGCAVIIWKQFIGLGIYEIIPGFIISFIAIYGVSLLTPKPDATITAVFDETDQACSMPDLA